MGKYFSDTARHAKAQEFLELKQGMMTVMEYVARFIELARFADDYVATDMAKVKRFENGLKLSIRGRIVELRLQDMDSMVGTTLTIEREIEDARSTRDAGVCSKRKESQSSSSVELGLEVEAFEEPMYVSSPLGIRARIGMICHGCELEISGFLLTVNLRIMDILEFDVILGMDWMTTYRVVIDCERRRITAYT